jgi:pimeloyl-ACP methyl ester carboxylesterase
VIRILFRSGRAYKDAFSSKDIQEYVDALSKPGALTAALNYYRANITVAGARRFAQWKPINAETLVIWGERDPALSLTLLEGLHEMVPRLHIHRIPGSSHWVQNEAPEEVNRVLLGFLKGRQ